VVWVRVIVVFGEMTTNAVVIIAIIVVRYFLPDEFAEIYRRRTTHPRANGCRGRGDTIVLPPGCFGRPRKRDSPGNKLYVLRRPCTLRSSSRVKRDRGNWFLLRPNTSTVFSSGYRYVFISSPPPCFES